MSVTNCDDCGACCMGQNLVPLSGAMLDNRTLPFDLREELHEVAMGPLAGDDYCPCIWLDRESGRCKHHEHRPQVCREFEVGGPDCLRIRREAGVEDPE